MESGGVHTRRPSDIRGHSPLLSSTLLPQLLNHFPIMKQQLLSFLSSHCLQAVLSIEDSNLTNNPAVAVYPKLNFFPQALLIHLINFALSNEFSFYIDVFDGKVRMRIYEDVES